MFRRPFRVSPAIYAEYKAGILLSVPRGCEIVILTAGQLVLQRQGAEKYLNDYTVIYTKNLGL